MPVYALLAITCIALWPTWLTLARIWHDSSDYSHGYLVIALVAAWIVIETADLPPWTRRGSVLAAAGLVACTLAWMIAYRASSDIGQQLVLPPILLLALATACGSSVARRLAPALLYLYFAIPIWDLLLPFLQQLTVWVTQGLLGSIGIPVAIDGVNIMIPEGGFRIAEGCSGKNYLMVALGLAAIHAALEHMPRRATLAYLAITAALALIMNWVRVLTVIYAGHVTDMRSYLVAREHISFGWALFAVLLVIVFLIGTRIARRHGKVQPTAPVLSPQVRTRGRFVRPITTAAALAIAFAVAARVADASRTASVEPLRWPQIREGGLDGPHAPGTDWSPRFVGATASSRAMYRQGARSIEVFAASYASQSRGAELVSFNNTLLGEHWIQVRADRLATTAVADSPLENVKVIEAQTPAGNRWLIAYLYKVGDYETSSGPMAQIAYGILAWLRPTASSIIATAVSCGVSCADATRVSTTFWEKGGDQMMLGLPLALSNSTTIAAHQ